MVRPQLWCSSMLTARQVKKLLHAFRLRLLAHAHSAAHRGPAAQCRAPRAASELVELDGEGHLQVGPGRPVPGRCGQPQSLWNLMARVICR